MELNAGAADDDELHAVIDQRLQERLALGVDGCVDATGVCWLSHSAILSPRRPLVGGARGLALALDVEHGVERERVAPGRASV